MPRVTQVVRDRIVKVNKWYKTCRADKEQQFKRMKVGFQYMTGLRQWEEDVRADLEHEGRPALQINHVLPIVMMMCGYQVQNRRQFNYFARRGGMRGTAELFTQLGKHAMDVSEGEYAVSESYQDGLTGSEGVLKVSIQYNDDPIYGDLKVEKISPFNFIEDQRDRSYSLEKCEYVFEVEWMTKEQVQHFAPDFAEEKIISTGIDEESFSPEHLEKDSDEKYSGSEAYPESGEDDKRILVKHCYWKEWETQTLIGDMDTGDYDILGPEYKSRIEAYRKMEKSGGFPQLIIKDIPRQVLHYNATMGTNELKYEKNPFGFVGEDNRLRSICMFPYFRFCPYWADGYPFGAVDNLIDLQDELNKRRSQTLHHLNISANSNILVDGGGEPEKRNLENNWSSTGGVWDRSLYGGKIEQLDPPRLPEGHFTLGIQAGKDMKDVSGANSDLMSTREANESGKARQARLQAGLVILASVNDKLDRTMRSMGYFMMELMRLSGVYSTEEITMIVEEHTLKDFVVTEKQIDPVSGMAHDVPTGELDLSLLQTMRDGRYGVRVGSSPDTPTMRMVYSEMLIKMKEIGAPIPWSTVIDATDLPNAAELAAEVKEQEQMMQKIAQQQMAMGMMQKGGVG